MTSPHGIPLDEETLTAMPAEERQFWEDFLEEAFEVMDVRQRQGQGEPLEPTDSLREKYQKALTSYDGAKYCQMWQLKQIFDWSEKVEETTVLN